MAKDEIPFSSMQTRVVAPIKYIEILTGHSDPKDFDGEDADIALERERMLVKYRAHLMHEISVVNNWIDNCKAIQARAMENMEGER